MTVSFVHRQPGAPRPWVGRVYLAAAGAVVPVKGAAGPDGRRGCEPSTAAGVAAAGVAAAGVAAAGVAAAGVVAAGLAASNAVGVAGAAKKRNTHQLEAVAQSLSIHWMLSPSVMRNATVCTLPLVLAPVRDAGAGLRVAVCVFENGPSGGSQPHASRTAPMQRKRVRVHIATRGAHLALHVGMHMQVCQRAHVMRKVRGVHVDAVLAQRRHVAGEGEASAAW